MISAILLGLALAMDATAVATARGVLGMTKRDAIKLALSFGIFQAGMAAIGWVVGAKAAARVAPWDRWIAFALLVGIGGKMIYEALRKTTEEEAGPPTLKLHALLVLSVATSIDALAAGVTLPLIPAPPPVSLAAIGIATFGLSLLGGLAGSHLGTKAGAKLEILGGLVLVGIAIKTVAM